MEKIEIKSLIDITKPNVHRPGQGTTLEQNQFKNWTTFQQCIGLRSIISYDGIPTVEEVDIKGLGFGSKFKGKHRVWTFVFYPDRSGAYVDEKGNTIGILLNDLHQVPVIEKLTETINTSKAVFDLEDPSNKNVVITVSVREQEEF
jgi:hypothetical protein